MKSALSTTLAACADTCRRIWRHPENRHRRVRTLAVYFVWQAWERAIGTPWTISLVPGRRIRCYPHCAISSGTLYYRLPERSSMRFVLDYLRPGDTMVDVGANLGTYSLLATTVEGVSAIAFEPSSVAYERAVQNVALNQLENRITVSRHAVGAVHGDVLLSVDLGACNKVIDTGSARPDVPLPLGEPVPMVTLDDALRQRPQASLVKIDVEGGEIDVLYGARSFINRHSPALIIEVNDPVRLEACLQELGYSCYIYDPETRRLRPTPAGDHLNRNVIALAGVANTQARIDERRVREC